MKKKHLLIASAFLLTTISAGAQEKQEQTALDAALVKPDVEINFSGTVNNGYTPFWIASNKYGTEDVKGSSGSLEVIVRHDADKDKGRNWQIGYGLDVIGDANSGVSFFLQQVYADINYKKVRLTIGSKERPMQLKNPELSSGSQTFGINSAPIPGVRFEIPDYINLASWIGIKGHIGYGMMMDGSWQKDYVNPTEHYVKNALYHTKAGYLRLGNPEKSPLIFEGGLEMACQFGGTVYRPATSSKEKIEMSHGLKDFIKAIYGGGSDETDGDYLNAQGNTVGSWLFSLKYQQDDWAVRAYYDHFFEDHSQLFFQYGWLDGLIGLELTLPKNRFVSSFVYEYVKTNYQAGPIYHDHTEGIPTQISAADNYYNHNLYQGWQYYGQAIGNPLFTSPLYRNDGTLIFAGNRFIAHHIGLCGHPLPELHYRLLYSYMTNWGTYNQPYLDRKFQHSFALKVDYAPQWLQGWAATAELGFDRGAQIGDNVGAALSISKFF